MKRRDFLLVTGAAIGATVAMNAAAHPAAPTDAKVYRPMRRTVQLTCGRIA
jgi:hypothetical protein